MNRLMSWGRRRIQFLLAGLCAGGLFGGALHHTGAAQTYWAFYPVGGSCGITSCWAPSGNSTYSGYMSDPGTSMCPSAIYNKTISTTTCFDANNNSYPGWYGS